MYENIKLSARKFNSANVCKEMDFFNQGRFGTSKMLNLTQHNKGYPMVFARI